MAPHWQQVFDEREPVSLEEVMDAHAQALPEAPQPTVASSNKRERSGNESVEIVDDSVGKAADEQPASKKRRTSQRNAEKSANEDGGASKSSPPSNARGHAGWNEGVKPAGLRISFGSKAASAVPKKVTVPINKDAETMEDTIVVQEPAAETSAEDTIVVQGEPDTAEPRAKKRRRTLKEKKAARAAAKAAAANDEPAQDGQAQAADSEMQTFRFSRQKWRLPPSQGSWGADESIALQFKLEQWVQDFVGHNKVAPKKMEILRDPSIASQLLQQAFLKWLARDGWRGTKAMVKELRKRGIAVLEAYSNENKIALLISTVEDNLARKKSMSPMPPLKGLGNDEVADEAGGASPGPAEPVMDLEAASSVESQDTPSGRSPGEISEHTDDVEGDLAVEDADETADRQRYYPGLTADQLFCTLCASSSHRSTSCPEASCRFCGSSEHMTPGCPTRQRCSKCKQLGHMKEACQEKLALAPGEVMECAFCASKEHTESDCTEFFRTYRPWAVTVHKVKHIPIYCYCCGNEGHYGTECGLNPAPTKKASVETWSVETWSKENWQQYVDPNSAEEAVAWVAGGGGKAAYAHDAHGRPDFGKSMAPRTHIIFEGDDDDDDDEGFIRPPVQRQQQQQHQNPQINVSRPQGRGGFSSLAQQAYNQNPPLPPGPPPGLPARPPQPSENGKQRNKRPRKQNASTARSQNQGRANGQQIGRGNNGGGGGGGFRGRGGAYRGGKFARR